MYFVPKIYKPGPNGDTTLSYLVLLFQTISRLDPKFIALHCQEVGGKNYEQSMRHVEDFVR